MYHPSRGGVRGGADQFEWDSIKSDKHRENYLGHSLKAPVGRWQKNKDLQWFSRDKKGGSQSNVKEKDAIKRMEAEAMAAALGHGPVKKQTQQLTRQELEEVCKKGQTERDEKDIERIEGMGFGSNRASLMDTLSSNTKETMSAVGTTKEMPKHENQAKAAKDIQRYERKEKKKSKKKEKKHRKKKSKKKRKSSNSSSDGEPQRRRHDSLSSSDHEKSTKREKQHYQTNEKSDTRQGSSKRQRTMGRHDSDTENEQRKRVRHDSSSSSEEEKTSRNYPKYNETKRNHSSHSYRKRLDSSEEPTFSRKHSKHDKEKEIRYPAKQRHESNSDDNYTKKSTHRGREDKRYEKDDRKESKKASRKRHYSRSDD